MALTPRTHPCTVLFIYDLGLKNNVEIVDSPIYLGIFDSNKTRLIVTMGGERRLIQILKTLFYYKSLFMKMLALKFQAEVDKYRLRGYFFPDSTNFGFAVIFRDFSFSQKKSIY